MHLSRKFLSFRYSFRVKHLKGISSSLESHGIICGAEDDIKEKATDLEIQTVVFGTVKTLWEAEVKAGWDAPAIRNAGDPPHGIDQFRVFGEREFKKAGGRPWNRV